MEGSEDGSVQLVSPCEPHIEVSFGPCEPSEALEKAEEGALPTPGSQESEAQRPRTVLFLMPGRCFARAAESRPSGGRKRSLQLLLHGFAALSDANIIQRLENLEATTIHYMR